jgi:predicted deacylase
MVGRGVAGIVNLMREMAMLTGPVTPRSAITFIGNKQEVVRAPRSGWAVLAVGLNADVAKGDEIAVLSDAFGRVTDRITAPIAGRISTIATEPRRDRGDMLVRIITNSDDPKCAMGC